jgi:hypothetical protein
MTVNHRPCNTRPLRKCTSIHGGWVTHTRLLSRLGILDSLPGDLAPSVRLPTMLA